MDSQRVERAIFVRQLLISGCSTAVCLAGGQVNAQESGSGSTGGLEEVVVTARKRSENLQDTPIAVTALTSETLERRGLVGTEDLDKVSPNLQFATYGPITGNNSASQVFIRGIGQTDARASVDPGVGLYIDDVYMGSAVGGAMDFRDIANVQVLRGPQGTLFGRNTIGGAVVLTTAQPGDELRGTIRAAVGSDDLREVSAAVDLPVSDTLKTRFSLGKRQREGYVFRADGTDLGDENTYTMTGKVLWEPSPAFDLTIKGDYTKEDEHGVPLVFGAINEDAAFPSWVSVAAGCPGAAFRNVSATLVDARCANNATWAKGPYTSSGTARLESVLENWGGAVIANIRLGADWAAKSITSYRELRWSGKRDADNTPFLILHTDFLSAGDQFSQELQLNYSGDSLQALIGAFYFKSTTLETFFADYTPPFSIGERSVNSADLGSNNWAVFGQVTYEVTDALALTFGARHTEETKSMALDSYQLGYAAGSVLVRNVDQNDRDLDFSDSSIAGSVQYRWNRDFMTYASYSEAFKSGGWNAAYNAPQPGLRPSSFDEEKAQSYEVGFKADITHSLRLNGAAFFTDYTDLQFLFRVGPVPLLFNAGEASVEGAELELAFAPDDKLTIEGSLGYLEAKIEKVATIVGTTTSIHPGSRLPYAPELTGNIGIGYAFSLGDSLKATPRIDYSYTSSQFFDSGNTIQIAQPDAVSNLDASFTVADLDDVWKVTLAGSNLTNEVYPVSGNSALTTASGYAEVAYVRPRSWSLSVQRNF